MGPTPSSSSHSPSVSSDSASNEEVTSHSLPVPREPHKAFVSSSDSTKPSEQREPGTTKLLKRKNNVSLSKNIVALMPNVVKQQLLYTFLPGAKPSGTTHHALHFRPQSVTLTWVGNHTDNSKMYFAHSFLTRYQNSVALSLGELFIKHLFSHTVQ
ncbi:hypothetical protein OUZ56_003345 [Daphnia magna]|uniref:Uncharacterized protein n=1 Tax=Daphnia magna TaxID=35525 RepID=A0ABR0A8V4_9CRUS|nr:hypothetical protein OUZ56_003345 [Daphnia magna]